MKHLYTSICVLLMTCNLYAMHPPFLNDSGAQAEVLLKKLTLPEKIGQLFVVAAASNFDQPTESLATALRKCPYNMDPEHIKKMIREYHVGGVIFLFQSDPKTQREWINVYQKETKIPLLIAQDLEWGLTMRLNCDPTKVVRYPRAMTLGALSEDNEQSIYQMGIEIGKQCAQVGVHMNFAPVVDVNNNPNNPVIHDRSFGDDPKKVARLSALYAQGLQDVGIIACAKHFPGHGDTDTDSHLDLPIINHTRNRLDDIELPPFKTLIDAGVGAVMNAHLAIPALDATPNRPSSMSYDIVTQLLQKDLAFQGLVVTDGLGMEAITKHYAPGDLEYQAFLAGNDIILCPLDIPRAVELIAQAIHDGTITEAELDRRVLKILNAKTWAFEQQKKHAVDDSDAYLIRSEAITLQHTLYRKTITLARNALQNPFDDALLKESCVIQIGGAPSNLCSEHAAKMHYASAGMADETVSFLTAAADTNTVIMYVYNLNKFAEKDFGVAMNTRLLMKQLKERGKKIIIVAFGTPYSIRHFNDADAIIMAYEDTPITQQAALDVLRGTLKAEGILPITMPS